MAEIHGHCDARFTPVTELMSSLVDSGEELGASLVVDVDGQALVDVWTGWADEARTRPWQEDTIVNVWSTTKTVTNLAALVCVERGLLDPYAPVSRYWPEFAANGKEAIEVRHLMSHTSGVSGWDTPFSTEDLYNWETATSRLAAQEPWWEPGTASGYHALNQGHLVGEVVRRVSGRTLKQFVAEELAGPLEADFQIGALEQDWGRIAPIVPPPPLDLDLSALDMTSPAVRTFSGPPVDASAANTAGWRGADIGAANGHGNARSVARLLRTIALGGTSGGVTLLSDDTISCIFDEQSNGVDLVLGLPFRFGIGYGLADPLAPTGVPTSGRVCYWGGWGGSMIIMDLDRRLTISYMMNRMGAGIVGSTRSEAYLPAILECAGA
jgi:CubicO group peptidase (beta-lactamase class C family)